jgi:hypothetical protein
VFSCSIPDWGLRVAFTQDQIRGLISKPKVGDFEIEYGFVGNADTGGTALDAGGRHLVEAEVSGDSPQTFPLQFFANTAEQQLDFLISHLAVTAEGENTSGG